MKWTREARDDHPGHHPASLISHPNSSRSDDPFCLGAARAPVPARPAAAQATLHGSPGARGASRQTESDCRRAARPRQPSTLAAPTLRPLRIPDTSLCSASARNSCARERNCSALCVLSQSRRSIGSTTSSSPSAHAYSSTCAASHASWASPTPCGFNGSTRHRVSQQDGRNVRSTSPRRAPRAPARVVDVRGTRGVVTGATIVYRSRTPSRLPKKTDASRYPRATSIPAHGTERSVASGQYGVCRGSVPVPEGKEAPPRASSRAPGLSDSSPKGLPPQDGSSEAPHDHLLIPRQPDNPTLDRQGHPLQPGRPCRAGRPRATLRQP